MVCPDTIVRSWPFPVGPREALTPTQRVFVDFLDAALAEGFAPQVERGLAFYEASGPGRGGVVYRRLPGRDVWEVQLWRGDEPRAMSGFVRGARAAVELVLRWLRGEDEHALWEALCAVATRRWRNGEFVGDNDPLPGAS